MGSERRSRRRDGRGLVGIGYGAFSPTPFSPDGRLVAANNVGAKTVDVYDTKTWRKVAALDTFNFLGFAPDGRSLFTFDWKRVIDRWNVGTWQKTDELNGHNAEDSEILSIDFSPDGKRIVTAGGVRQDRAGMGGTDRELTAAAFSADGKWLLFTCNDRITRILPRERFAPVDELLALARTRITRAMTDDERLKYLHEAAARAGAGTPRASLPPASSYASAGPTPFVE